MKLAAVLAAATLLSVGGAAEGAPLREWPKKGAWQVMLNEVEDSQLHQCLIGLEKKTNQNSFGIVFAAQYPAPQSDLEWGIVLLDSNRDNISTSTLGLRVDKDFFGRYRVTKHREADPPAQPEGAVVLRVSDPDLVQRLFKAMQNGEYFIVATANATYSFDLNGFPEAYDNYGDCLRRLRDEHERGGATVAQPPNAEDQGQPQNNATPPRPRRRAPSPNAITEEQFE